MIPGQTESLADFPLDAMLLSAVLRDIEPRFCCGQLGGGPVLSCGADAQHLVTALAQVARVHVGGQHGADQVAQMLDAVDVGQRRRDQISHRPHRNRRSAREGATCYRIAAALDSLSLLRRRRRTMPAATRSRPTPSSSGAALACDVPGRAVVPKLKQQTPSISSGSSSSSAMLLVTPAFGCAEPNEYDPISSSRLDCVAPPTSTALTLTVIVHGLFCDGVVGQLTLPVSLFAPVAGASGYSMTCGSHAETEHRSMLCAFPA